MFYLTSGSRYHKQFKSAAKQRYFVSQEDDVYFHSYMADYFLGTYGGGISKPFRYTEVKFIFNLKKESLSCVCADPEAHVQVEKQRLDGRSKLSGTTACVL